MMSVKESEITDRIHSVDVEETEPVFLNLASSPHIRHSETVSSIMMWVIIALIPSLIMSYFIFGWRAIFLTAVSVTTAVVVEFIFNRLQKKTVSITDLSAVITGILLAFSVSPLLPWWMVAVGSAFAIGIAKMPFGGLGCNFVNPALAGRAFLMACYPTAMTTWLAPQGGTLSGMDGVSNATPLSHIKVSMANHTFQALDFQDALSHLLIGNVGGCIGETSVIALLIGAILLLYKRTIGFSTPATFIGTVFLLFWIFNGTGDWFTTGALVIPFYHILAGGLCLGAFFMATDMVTSPATRKGKLIFGAGCGLLTFAIRKFGGYPEGVAYAILVMNLFVPLIDRYTRPVIYGKVKTRD